MSFKEDKGREGAESPLDRKLDELLMSSIEVSPPTGLVDQTMKRLPETQNAPFPWWAWVVYVAFFATAVVGLAYWQSGALVSAITEIALLAPKAVALAVQYPYVVLVVAGVFLLDAVLVWFLAADLVLRKRLAGVMAS